MFLAHVVSTEPSRIVASGEKGRKRKEEALNREKSDLLWKILIRQPEYVDGTLKIDRKTIIRTVLNSPDYYLSASERTMESAIQRLVSNSRSRVEDTLLLTRRVVDAYQKEMAYREGVRQQFSVDVLFSVVHLLSLDNDPQKANQTIDSMKLGPRQEELSAIDREIMKKHFRVYVVLKKSIQIYLQKFKNMSEILAKRDSILQGIELALLKKGDRTLADMTILASSTIFQSIVAEHYLANKRTCGVLISAWALEYGFQEHLQRINLYIDVAQPLSDFLNQYYQAIKTKVRGAEPFDEFLLRSLRNFYVEKVEYVRMRIAA